MLTKNFKEMLQCLSDEGVRFLLVGGYALAAHGYERATKDMDFFVWADNDNATRLLNALQKFGAPLHDVTERDFAYSGTVFQIGVPPERIDIITSIDGVSFEDAYQRRESRKLDGIDVPVIALDDLITNKRVSARPQDLIDVRKLEKLRLKQEKLEQKEQSLKKKKGGRGSSKSGRSSRGRG